MVEAFLGLIAVLGGAAEVIKRSSSRMTGNQIPEPQDWTLRMPSGIAHFAEPHALEEDIWEDVRDYLNEDIWRDRRDIIQSAVPRTLVPGNPRRRQYIIEELDGGESIYPIRPGRDIFIERESPNVNSTTLPPDADLPMSIRRSLMTPQQRLAQDLSAIVKMVFPPCNLIFKQKSPTSK